MAMPIASMTSSASRMSSGMRIAVRPVLLFAFRLMPSSVRVREISPYPARTPGNRAGVPSRRPDGETGSPLVTGGRPAACRVDRCPQPGTAVDRTLYPWLGVPYRAVCRPVPLPGAGLRPGSHPVALTRVGELDPDVLRVWRRG